MDRIPPRLLWIGHAGDGRDMVGILNLGLEAVVQLAIEEEPIRPARELINLRFPLSDGAGNRVEVVRMAILAVATLLSSRLPTLVCCGAGRSRAPAIAAGAFARLDGGSAESHLLEIARHRRCDVSPGLWRDVRAAIAAET